MQVEAVIPAVNASEGSSAGLTCEMRGYIRPDSDFQWRRGGDTIENTSKHTITYSEGLPSRARDGGSELVSSRTSSLQIADIDESDAGQYTCFVQGTEAAATVQLEILNDMPGKNSVPTFCILTSTVVVVFCSPKCYTRSS